MVLLNKSNELLVLFLCFIVEISFAQSKKIDSLQTLVYKFDLVSSQKEATLKDSVKVNLLNSIAIEEINFNVDKALVTQMKSIHLAKRINYTLGIISGYNNLSRVFLDKGEFYKSLDYANTSLKINKVKISLEQFYLSNLLKGQANLFLNNFPEASKFLTLALELAERLNDPVKKAKVYNNIAIIYNKQNKTDEELKNFNKALQSIKYTNTNTANKLRNVVIKNIGQIYITQKKYDEALAIFQQCLEFEKKNYNRSNFAMSSRSLSMVYFGKKDFKKALEYAQTSLAIYKEIGNKSGEGDMYREIGTIFLEMSQYQKALNFTNKGLEISTQIGELESIKFCYEKLAIIHSKLKNYKSAYHNQVLFKKMSDSMFNSEVNNKVTQIQMTYEFEKKQKQLQILQREKEEKMQLKSKKQQNFLTAILLTLFFLCIITIGIYSNLKASKKQKLIVEQQKEQIQHSLTEKETLLREIHHRVKNNLQIISSLLNMQSEDIDDPKVLMSIQEGQSRVQAMSLIHQNLYQSETIDKVTIENYFRELTDYLSTMYLGNVNSIKVDIQTPTIQFDFDTAIPLGLIVNELVSNAYKHAFSDQKEGKITIKIVAQNETDYQLIISNNGKPLPNYFDIQKTKSLGVKLVTILSKQLRGSFSQIEGDETTFQVLFKDLKKYNSTK
jgi:two-component system, sensor histidine kinase PdtaS